MQIKRLEQQLDLKLVERRSGGMKLTREGMQLLPFAQKMIALNDSAYSRLTASEYQGSVRVGVPGDICTLTLPKALRAFNEEFPRAWLDVHIGQTVNLKSGFAEGEYDLILTTELQVDHDAHLLRTERLVWVGAPSGNAFRQRPLPLGINPICAFRTPLLEALNAAGIDHVELNHNPNVDGLMIELLADMCVDVELESVAKSRGQVLADTTGLPRLPDFSTGMQYRTDHYLAEILASHISKAYR